LVGALRASAVLAIGLAVLAIDGLAALKCVDTSQKSPLSPNARVVTL
jgi:hypothetical protein